MNSSDDPFQPPAGANPFQPPQWSSGIFSEAAGGIGDRGLIGHVRIVAILLIVQGILELLFCTLGFGFLVLVQVMPKKEAEALRGVGMLLAAISVPALIVAVLRITAGIFNFRYRRRGLGMIALLVGLLMMITGYCAPTAIALAVYGLIVYVNEPVVMAFAMGDSGRPVAEIQSAHLIRH